MMLTKGAIGNLINRYSAVLKKCSLINTFGSLAVAGMLVAGGVSGAMAETTYTAEDTVYGIAPGGKLFTQTGASSITSEMVTPTENITTITLGTVTLSGSTDAKYGVLSNMVKKNTTDVVSQGLNIQKGIFSENTSVNAGGAVTLWTNANTSGKVADSAIDGTTFTKNTATAGGGALSIMGQASLATEDNGSATVKNTMFDKNSTAGYGGAIWNQTKLKVETTKFTGNTANFGGAIFNEGTATVTGTAFTENKANNDKYKAGGAIYNAGGAQLTITKSTFEGNTAGVGGAINNYGKQNAPTSIGTIAISDSKFTNNTAGIEGAIAQGGAIRNQGTITGITNTEFTENKGNGGAINNGSWGTISLISGSTFSNNSCATSSEPNKISSQGGAITNAGTITSITDTTFTGNSADNGGAFANVTPQLNNDTKSAVTFNNTTFTDNNAKTQGGALWNIGNVAFTGNNTFSGNKANGALNDIYNTGTLSLGSEGSVGSLTLDGGITGNGTLQVVSGAEGTLVLKENTLLENKIGVKGTLNINGNFDISKTKTALLDVEGTLNITGDMNIVGFSAFKGNELGSINVAKTLIADTASADDKIQINDTIGLTVGALLATQAGTNSANDKAQLEILSGTHTFTGLGADKSFFNGTALTVTGGALNLGSTSLTTQGGTSTAAVTVTEGALNVTKGDWTTGALTQLKGTVNVTGGNLTVASLDQTDGLLTVGGTSNTGKLTVDGSFANTTYNAGTAGVAVTGTGVLGVKYSELVNAAGNDFLYTATQKAINVAEGGTLLLNGYSGSGITVADFKALTDNILDSNGNGTVQGITVTYNNETLQVVGDAHAALTTTVVDGSSDLSSGAATVGGVTGATTVSGNAALTLTGQASGNALADNGVTLNGGILTLGNPVGGSTGGTLQGGIDASTGTNTINVVNGTHTVDGGIIGNATTKVAVGGSANSGTLIATDVSMNGGQINFDPPFAAAGDTSNASMGGLTFTSNNVDALMTVGQNSMVSLGSTDAEWLRTQVQRFQSDGKGLWGQDITAALALRSPQTLDATGGINVDGTWVSGGSAATANTARFADKSLLVVDAAGVGSSVALSGEAGGTSTLTVDSGAKLHIVGGQDGETVNVTGGFGASTKDAVSWAGSNLTTSTALLSATGGTFDTANGEYSVTLKANAAASSFPLLSSSMGTLVDRMVVQAGVNPNSSNAGVRFISRAVSDNYIGTTDSSHAAATIEGAAQLAAVGAVQGSTLSAATAASGAVTTRTSMALPRADRSQAVAVRQDTDGSLSLDSGLSAGDGLKNGLGVWIMPLYQSNNVWGMKAENFKSGYNSNLGGIALGADYTINDMFRFGAAFNVGAGYAKSSGDFNSTDNRFNFWGVNLYGGWVYDNFGLSADVGYTGNYSKVEQDMPASMQMRDLKADVTSHAWNTGLKAEYKFNAGAVDIIPHVGVRYLGLVTDGYDVKSGGTVFEVDGNTQSIWTFPVGVSFAKAFETESGWQFKPQLDLGVIPAAGDVKARSKARVPGVDSQAEMKMQVVDYATFDGGLGFELGKGDFTLGLNYNLQASEHRTGHGVFGSLRYEF